MTAANPTSPSLKALFQIVRLLGHGQGSRVFFPEDSIQPANHAAGLTWHNRFPPGQYRGAAFHWIGRNRGAPDVSIDGVTAVTIDHNADTDDHDAVTGFAFTVDADREHTVAIRGGAGAPPVQCLIVVPIPTSATAAPVPNHPE